MQGVDELRAELKRARDEMGLVRTPGKIVRNFILVIIDGLHGLLNLLLHHKPLFAFVVAPLLAAWTFTHIAYPEAYRPPVCGEMPGGAGWEMEFAVREAAWWITLGVLSSVGFGTGLHSGLMFLFPHVMNVVLTVRAGRRPALSSRQLGTATCAPGSRPRALTRPPATRARRVGQVESCETVSGLHTSYTHPCKLDCSTTPNYDDGTATFLAIVAKVWPSCFLWGLGTAIGELPPYLVSKAARLAGQRSGDFEAEIEAARTSSDVFSRLKLWTMDFTEKHGFIGVMLLAGWPNAAFDMCGMCCGYLLMPFWTFFPAVVVGKAVLKVSGQACFFVALFGKSFYETVLNAAVRPVDALSARYLGTSFSLAELGSQKRLELLLKFKKQVRAHAGARRGARPGARPGLSACRTSAHARARMRVRTRARASPHARARCRHATRHTRS